MRSEVIIRPSLLLGTVTVPYSKSQIHRMIICGALSKGEKFLNSLYKDSLSEDVLATLNAMKSILKKERNINCFDSGSTLRFLIPITCVLNLRSKFILGQGLSRRPIYVYKETLSKSGISMIKNGNTIDVLGKLKPGVFEIQADISSQFISGLMFALPLLSSESRIILSTPLKSRPYVDMTIHVLKKFGVTVIKTRDGFIIPGNQNYIYTKFTPERDWSQAAFFLSASAIGNSVFIKDMNIHSIQGDKSILDVLEAFGARRIIHENKISFLPCKLTSTEIDISDTPDLAPIVSVVASLAEGWSRIYGVERLKFKESDRLCAIIDCLKRMGVECFYHNDSLFIKGTKNLKGGHVLGYADHRIVMAMSIAATRSRRKTFITDARSIFKSYKNFFDDYKMLGGKFDVIGNW